MSDRLREALERFYDSKRPNVDDEFVIADAARRWLALTETGERLAAAIDEMDADTINQTEADLRSDDLFYKWDELIHAAIEIRTALSDYLTEEDP